MDNCLLSPGKKNHHIRHATPQDIDGLVALEATCFTADRVSRQSFKHLLHSPSAEILIAEHENKIIGSAILFFRKNSNIMRIYSLAVHTEHRQQKIAANLHQAIEERAIQRGCTRIILEVRPDNHAAIAFYRKHEYDIFGKYNHYYEDGSDALRMETCLNKGKQPHHDTRKRDSA
jgi:ribosomal protein S18 acetylase RimI-like enzyme